MDGEKRGSFEGRMIGRTHSFRSVLSSAVPLTSLFFHFLGLALINAIEVNFSPGLVW